MSFSSSKSLTKAKLMSSYPPYLDQIHDHCPKASLLYTKFWREKGADNKVIYDKDQITLKHSISWKTFTFVLRVLKWEGVLDYEIVDKRTININLKDAPQDNMRVAC